MVRSMWLLLELLWKTYCHHPLYTKILVDVRFRGLSHVARCPGQAARQKRERETEAKQVLHIPRGLYAFSAACAEDSILWECNCSGSYAFDVHHQQLYRHRCTSSIINNNNSLLCTSSTMTLLLILYFFFVLPSLLKSLF